MSARDDLSKRERQIMDALYKSRRASAAEIQKSLPKPPSYTAVRTLLGILEQKGHVRHTVEGPRYVYEPTAPLEEVAERAINNVLQTFFEGSVERAMATLLTRDEANLTDEQLTRLAEMIEQARKEGR
jgi:predicted transcriptional regulator